MRTSSLPRAGEEIRTGITGADAVAFVITPDSVVFEVCRTELNYATEVSKRLVPILARLTGHTSFVNGVTFSPDGQMPATSSSDDTVRFWELDADRVTAHLCHIIGISSRADWARLVPDLPYQPTCP